MATKVNIWNMALARLGNTKVVGADTDQTTEALTCSLFWDNVLDDVLRAVAWPFTTKIAALAGKAAAPNADWAFSYTYPNDCVTARRIIDTATRNSSAMSKIPFRARTNDKIYTDIDNAILEYTERVIDTTKFSADFVQCVALLLAVKVAPAVAGVNNVKLATEAKVEYDAKVKEAAANASAEEKEVPSEIVVGANPKEDIVNAALSHLGLDYEVRSLTAEKTLAARTARQFYDKTRDDVLRSFAWGFARKSAALGTKVAAPNTEWAFSYAMPADAVLPLKVFDAAGRIPFGQSRVPFRRSTNDLIYTNVDNATLEYTMRHDTPAQYPPDFANQLALKLAMRMAPRLCKAADLKGILDHVTQLYQNGLKEAIENALVEDKDVSPETSATVEPIEDICNMALTLLGSEAEIQDLETELTKEARALRQFYLKSVDQVLRDFDWGFARKTATLVLAVANPTNEWLFSYTIPSDCLAMRRILDGSGVRAETETSRVKFIIANATVPVIFTDQESAQAQYTVRVADPLQFPADFITALAAYLAFKVAPRLVPSKDRSRVQADVWAQYRQALGQAQVSSAMEEVPELETDSSLERARS